MPWLGLSAVASRPPSTRDDASSGGRVSLWLPLAASRRKGGWQMRLVMCDDNRILCEALASIFQARGHEVVVIATSVAAGITAVAEHRPDACLMDLRFPDGSGVDVIRAIRRSGPDTKIVVLSCLADPATVA